MTKKKEEHINLRIDPELRVQAEEYARKNGVSLAALIRRLLRYWTDPKKPRKLPKGIEEERKRPSRRKSEPFE